MIYRGVYYINPDSNLTGDCKTIKMVYRGVTYFKRFRFINGFRYPYDSMKVLFPGSKEP